MPTLTDLKGQFTKLSGFVTALDLGGYLSALPGLAEITGHPEQAAELRDLIHGVLTGDVRDIVKGTEGIVNDALAAYYHFPKLTVSAGTVEKDHANLARCLKSAAEKCEGTAEPRKVGASGAETPAKAIDGPTVLAIGQLVMALLTYFRSRKPA